jgi:hypothetical protein
MLEECGSEYSLSSAQDSMCGVSAQAALSEMLLEIISATLEMQKNLSVYSNEFLSLAVIQKYAARLLDYESDELLGNWLRELSNMCDCKVNCSKIQYVSQNQHLKLLARNLRIFAETIDESIT